MIHYRFSQSWKHFNTSHVNVNQGKRNDLDDLYDNFNTSHVNVNRCLIRARSLSTYISIHLMLMLISCDGLRSPVWFLISIHLMLMLIFAAQNLVLSPSIISIHLMLMLIKVAQYNVKCLKYFNTSHVNVNPAQPCYWIY